MMMRNAEFCQRSCLMVRYPVATASGAVTHDLSDSSQHAADTPATILPAHISEIQVDVCRQLTDRKWRATGSRFCCWFMIVCLLLTAGCQAMPNMGLLLKEDKTNRSVRRALTMWAFSSQEQADGQMQTGFQGKALFFGEGNDEARATSGHIEVLIYELVATEWKLRRKFISEGEAWKQNERETALGTVYDIFVPHETQPQQRYALVLTLQAEDGKIVKSPVAHLP